MEHLRVTINQASLMKLNLQFYIDNKCEHLITFNPKYHENCTSYNKVVQQCCRKINLLYNLSNKFVSDIYGLMKWSLFITIVNT